MRFFQPLKQSYRAVFAPSEEALKRVLKFDPKKITEFRVPQQTVLWTKLNLARGYYHSFIQTAPGTPLILLRQHATAYNPKKDEDLVEAWKTRNFSTIQELAEYYEAVINPALSIIKKIDGFQAESYALKDVLRLKVGSQAQLDKARTQLLIITDKIEFLKKQLKEYASSAFSTEIYNSILNIFRLAAESDDHAHRYAIQLLEDMTALGVPCDETTRLLMKKICFGDEPKEDSDMLFSYVELPEMGEVVLNAKNVKQMNKDAVRTAADRHNIEITEGRFMQNAASHPNLIQNATQ
uniref:Uncharacterized protein n=1 Tax=Paramoeba aestuarina TaxID=180227 RepID=A0A7S4UHP1_9EUKA|mmetsp:Transcript_34473/g.53803  ORF Transcript_34473/g.53803 Transcript_34473/m.53803 type:complete len:295 (+) Transcript_34473:28-912(+)